MKFENICFNKKNEAFLLENKSKVKFIENFIDTKTADKLYQHLIKLDKWEHGVYKMFGKDIKTPRLLWAMRDKNFDISKSYTVTDSSIWTKKIEKLKTEVENLIQKKIKYAQINYYRDGNDYIGWHTDSEVVEGDLIASISLGVSRNFQFRPIDKQDTSRFQVELTNGSLIVFDDSAAKYDWKHRIPKQPKIEDGRINITFRLR